MAYTISIRCEKDGVGSQCGWVSWDTMTPDIAIPAGILQDMADRGWVERDGKHYCPRHDPQTEGQMVKISVSYTEVAPGVHVRDPRATQEGDFSMIEVRVIAPGTEV